MVVTKATEVIGFATIVELLADKVAISQTAAGAKLEFIITITIMIMIMIMIIIIMIIVAR